MTLATILLGLWALLLAARSTPIGDWLEFWLVARPAAALARIRHQTVLGGATIALIAFVCWWVIGHEGLLMVSIGLPELGTALAAIDLGALFDIALVLVATASAGGWRAIRAVAARRAPTRASRARRTRALRKPAANDDGEGRARALAA